MVLRCRPKLFAIAAEESVAFGVSLMYVSLRRRSGDIHDDPFLLEDSSVSQIASPPRGLSHLPVEFRAPNCPHKLTKTAEPWLGGGAALSGSDLHAAAASAAVRSRYCM